jgi:hypothetical protein
LLDDVSGRALRDLTCHANGTFLRFAMITRKAKIRDLEPGPVNTLINRSRRLARDAAAVTARALVKAIDFSGNAVADAMVNGG